MSESATADLRALAERLGMLRPCEVCCEGRVTDCASLGELDACWSCGGTGQRLPAEAEVRAAIFEAGWGYVDTFASPRAVSVEGVERVTVEADEAAPDELVLLALLRALEVARDA